jgi:hypothetical protein
LTVQREEKWAFDGQRTISEVKIQIFKYLAGFVVFKSFFYFRFFDINRLSRFLCLFRLSHSLFMLMMVIQAIDEQVV